MRPEDKDIAKMLKKSLPSAQREEEAGKRVSFRLRLAKTDKPATSVPNDNEDDFGWRPPRRFSIAVPLAAVASLLFMVVLSSALWKIWRTTTNIATASLPVDPVRNGESVRADGPGSRMLVLSDGSQVELRSKSEFQVDHAADGLRVRLYSGSAIVTAAKQGSGHLYVETKDAVVSVVGTVFVVSVDQDGSRAGVFEGVVNVQHGATSEKLVPGQQTATAPAMEAVPLETQVSWSRNLASLVAMLRQPAPPTPSAQPPAAVASAVPVAPPVPPPQSRPAAPSPTPREAPSLLILGGANGASRGQQPLSPRPEADRDLEQGLSSRDPITDLAFSLETDYFQLNRAEYSVPVTVKIPGTQLAGSQTAKRLFFDVAGKVIDDYGTTTVNFRDGIDIMLSYETANQLPSLQIAYDTRFTLLPGRYSLKFVIRDGITGRMGNYQTAFVIPNLTKEAPNLPISSVVLSSELISLENALVNGSQSPGSSVPADPLMIEGKKLVPGTTRTFSKRGDLVAFLQTYELITAASEPLTASVNLVFYRGQTKVLDIPQQTFKDGQTGRQLKTLPIRLRVPLASVPVGTYDCEITVVNPVTQKSAVWRAPINVVN